MLNRKFVLILAVLALMTMAIVPAMAQDIIAEGLPNARNMSYDSDGNLYVALAGVAGPQLNINDTAYGATGGVLMIAPDGAERALVNGLISISQGATRGGAGDVYATADSLWVLLSEVADPSIPFGTGLIEVDRTTGRIKTFVDLWTPELEMNPDGNDNGESNPVDMEVLDDGSILIANAGCNCLMSWSAENGVEIVNAWDFQTDNPVPTAVEVGPDGDIYVGFLTGFPFPQGGSRIERWSGGELAQTYEGLTMVSSVLVTDAGEIYATEFGVFDPNQGFGPGRIVQVTDEGITPLLENLNAPYGLAQSPDGTIIASINSTGGPDGQIIVVPTE